MSFRQLEASAQVEFRGNVNVIACRSPRSAIRPIRSAPAPLSDIFTSARFRALDIDPLKSRSFSELYKGKEALLQSNVSAAARRDYAAQNLSCPSASASSARTTRQ